MSSTASAFPGVIDALIATFAAVSNVTAFDGPEFELSGDDGDYVIVGGDCDDQGALPDAGALSQKWAGLGAHHRDEEGGITCAIVVQTGDSTIKPSRDRAFTILAGLTTALTDDPTLGGAVSSGWILPLQASPSQWQNDVGSFCRIPFTVSFEARL